MTIKGLAKRIVSWIVTMSIVLSCVTYVSAFNIGNTLDGDIKESELVSLPTDDEVLYSKTEVIVLIDNTKISPDTQICSLYSDDYVNLNQEHNTLMNTQGTSSIKIADDTNKIKSILDLDIDFSEMKLLNPSGNSNARGLYTINENNNNIFSIKLNGISVEEAISILNKNPAVKIAEPNFYYEFTDPVEEEVIDKQYAFNYIKATSARNQIYSENQVVVGIIDSGIDSTHADLADDLWKNPNYTEGIGCSVCGRVDDEYGYNFTGLGNTTGKPSGGNPSDGSGHGTHVAGIVENICDNDGSREWKVSIAWLGTSVGGNSLSVIAAIEALNYAEEHGIRIVNNSYGGESYSSIFEQAINNYDGLFIAAAGNSQNGNNNDITPHYPASYDCSNIISVASTDYNNDRSSFSHYGSESVHVAAPGSDIYSTVPGGTSAYKSGTSMACPMVTGIAGLIMAKNPNLTPVQIKTSICSTIQQMGKTYNIMYDGGIVDAEAAVSVLPTDLKSITFDYNYTNSSTPVVEYALVGNCVREPSIDPHRSGFIFNGWYTSATGGTLFDFDTPISSNITLYAQWITPSVNSYASKFPDYRFRDIILYMVNGTDAGTRTANSSLSTDDITKLSKITSINVSGRKIHEMTGIEYLSGLTSLDCSCNYIETLNVSNSKKLVTLDCSNNLITTLNISGLTKLEDLNVSSNHLTSGNFSSFAKLKKLNCAYNNISLISVNTLVNLEELYCNNNELETLSVSSLNNLTKLICSYNNISWLSISNLNLLRYVDCSFNELTSLTTGSGVVSLLCNNNNLTRLNITNSLNLYNLYTKANHLSIVNGIGLNKIVNIDLRFNEMSEKSDFIGFDDWNIPIATISAFGPQNLWTQNDFSDVDSSSYYYKAIQYVHERDIMLSKNLTTFGTTDILTRSELALIIYRLAGKPSVAGLSNPFTDISSNADYVNAVKWLYNNGNNSIMNGTSATAFSPNVAVTREMLAVVLDRYATRTNITFELLRDYQQFTDDSSIPSWAKDSVINMYRAGIINGDENNKFNPGTTIQRKDTAVVIRRFEVIRQFL